MLRADPVRVVCCGTCDDTSSTQGYCRVLYQQYYGRYISPNQIRSRLKAASGLKYGNRVDQRERSAAHAAQHPMPADPLAFRQVFS